MNIINEKFPAHELQSDLAFIKNKAVYKRYNHDGLLFVGKERFYQLYDSIKNVINKKGEMSRLEFYFLTAPLVSSLQDDKSIYGFLGDYAYDYQKKEYLSFAERYVLPFGVHVFHDSVFITTDSLDLYKSHIISINDIPANKIVSDIWKYTSYKRYRYYKKNKYGAIAFYYYPILLNFLFGIQNEVEIKYSSFESDTILSTQIELLPIGDSLFFQNVKNQYENRKWYSIDFEKDIAILRFGNLPSENLNLEIYNEIFKKISNNKSNKLIIDISSCTASFDNFWIILLNYLTDGKLWLYEYHDKPQDLSSYTKKRIKNSKYIDGKYTDIDKKYKFEGETYLITGPLTASSAVRFADILKYNKIVEKIYGRETLSKATQYDYFNRLELPVTGIYLGLSVTLHYALDRNLNKHGFLPDIEIKPNNVEEFLLNNKNKFVIDKVINLIESENQKDENTSD